MPRLSYPAARSAEQVDELHGRRIADPYRWLEEVDAPETRAWIAAQNRVTEAFLAGVPGRDAIRRRVAELWDHPRAGSPWRRGWRWFQLRNSGLENQDVLWTMDRPDARGRVLLDPNELSADGTVALAASAVSDDGALLAYALSERGSDWMTWRVREVETGRDRPDRLAWSKFSTAGWSPDASGFFYARYAEPAPADAREGTNRNQLLVYHRLGAAQDEDAIVYARPDEPDWGWLPRVTEDGRYLVVHVWQGTDVRNRLYFGALERSRPPAIRPLIDALEARYQFCGSDGPVWYLLTDLDAPRGRVVAVDLRRPERTAWREVVPEADDALEVAALIGGRLVCVYLEHASHRVVVHPTRGGRPRRVRLPGIGTVDDLAGRQDDADAFYRFTTFTAPPSIHRIAVAGGRGAPSADPRARRRAGHLVTERAFVPSGDGTPVPLFLVHRRGLRPGQDAPTLLVGYGGFRISMTPAYRPEWRAWLELGGLLAVAALRGGGEYGQAWHDGGRLANKQNVFDDFAACAAWLVASGWTRRERLAVAGRSNGGLLVGATITQRPELVGAAVAEVGVMDMLRFHRFTIGWAWTSDYGSPDDPEQFQRLLGYSPLHNVRPGTRYPATLLTTGDHDDRVVPGHSFKFAAALQAAQAGDEPILIRIETDAGHGAGKPTAKLIEERSDVLAFLVHALGVEVALRPTG